MSGGSCVEKHSTIKPSVDDTSFVMWFVLHPGPMFRVSKVCRQFLGYTLTLREVQAISAVSIIRPNPVSAATFQASFLTVFIKLIFWDLTGPCLSPKRLREAVVRSPFK